MKLVKGLTLEPTFLKISRKIIGELKLLKFKKRH